MEYGKRGGGGGVGWHNMRREREKAVCRTDRTGTACGRTRIVN